MPRLIWAGEAFRCAIRLAAVAHRDQTRRGSGDPYIIHPFLVARTVEEAGFDDQVVIAALLHDVVEDSAVTLDDLKVQFSPLVASIVAGCTEVKRDARGQPIPWEDRKRDHMQRLRAGASSNVRAVVLADKLDNLRTIQDDLAAGRPVWEDFHAPRDRVLWYHKTIIEICARRDHRNHILGESCRRELERVRSFPIENPDSTGPEG